MTGPDARNPVRQRFGQLSYSCKEGPVRFDLGAPFSCCVDLSVSRLHGGHAVEGHEDDVSDSRTLVPLFQYQVASPPDERQRWCKRGFDRPTTTTRSTPPSLDGPVHYGPGGVMRRVNGGGF